MFDRVVVVDWSASSRPKVGRDSIWIADLDIASRELRSQNVSTRHGAFGHVDELCGQSGRTLLGVDFSLGYPSGTAHALGLDGEPWCAMWSFLVDEIVDADDNANNRFEVAARMNDRMTGGPGPFWGAPPSKRSRSLTSTKVGSGPVSEWRRVEADLRSGGHRPFSSWQLLGVGSVGSQSLLGIPWLERLRRRSEESGRSVDVWPFTCGIVGPAADLVICEVWPSLVGLGADPHRVRDDLQVRAVAVDIAGAVHNETINAWFEPAIERGPAIEEEEGWVLGWPR